MKKMAILTLTPEALRSLLQLPDGAVLVDFRVPFDRPGVLELLVEGVGWVTPEGATVMRAPAAEVKWWGLGGDFSVDWQLPEE